MQLKNYTSAVPVSRTISRIEEFLAAVGATGISKDYNNGKLLALTFSFRLPSGQDVKIRLPANVNAVYIQMMKGKRRACEERIKAQAERTAWKLMQDWVEIQLSLIQMQQADFMQVFLSYVWDGQQTFYKALKDGGFKQLALPAPAQEDITVEVDAL